MQKPPSLQTLVTLLLQTSRGVRERVRLVDRVSPLSMMRCHTLNYIAQNGPVSLKDVSDYLNIQPPTATILVRKLTAAGQIMRMANPKDGRSVFLSITPEGRQTISKTFRHMRSHIQKVLSCLTPEERFQFAHILEKIASFYQ